MAFVLQNVMTATLHSLLDGIDLNFQGLRTTMVMSFCVRKERMVKVSDGESLAPHRCEFETY